VSLLLGGNGVATVMRGKNEATPFSPETTDWEPVARVPRKRPARYSTYGRRDNSDDDSSASIAWVAPDI